MLKLLGQKFPQMIVVDDNENLFIYIYSIENLHDKLLDTLLKLLYNTTATIPRGAKYNDNPEALKRRRIEKKNI